MDKRRDVSPSGLNNTVLVVERISLLHVRTNESQMLNCHVFFSDFTFKIHLLLWFVHSVYIILHFWTFGRSCSSVVMTTKAPRRGWNFLQSACTWLPCPFIKLIWYLSWSRLITLSQMPSVWGKWSSWVPWKRVKHQKVLAWNQHCLVEWLSCQIPTLDAWPAL